MIESPEILVKKKNISLDSQILSSIMACARLTDFRFNLNLVSIHGKSSAIEMGSIVHEFFAGFYGSLIEGKFRSTSMDIGLERAHKYMNSSEVMNTSPEDKTWALETCEQYCDFYKNDHWVPLEIEVVKGKILYEDDEIRVLYKGKVDLIVDTNQGIYPVDHKTMKQRRETSSMSNQFMGYCLLLDSNGVMINKIGFQTSLKKEEKFTRNMVSYSRERLEEWQSVILPWYTKMLIAYHETGFWPANLTHCENKYGFCQFKKICECNPNDRENQLRQNYVTGEPWEIESE